MRAVLCCAAALAAISSTALGERIHIEGVIADYVTAEQVVDVEIWLSEPFDPAIHNVRFVGQQRSVLLGSPGGYFRIDNGTWRDTTDAFSSVAYHTATPNDRLLVDDVPARTFNAMRDGAMRHVIAFDLPADSVRLTDLIPDQNGFMDFYYSASVRIDDTSISDAKGGFSTVDDPRNVATPEPSSVALAAIGVALLAVHLRRPRPRQRGGKGCAGGESDRVGA